MIANRRAIVVDTVIALTLIVGCAAIALQYLHAESRRGYFFDWELVPATMMACGRGFTHPTQPVAALSAFAVRQTEVFDCALLAPDLAVTPASQIALSNRYGLSGPAVAMRLGSPTWTSLDRYIAVLFGLSMALSYGLLRLITMRPIAVLGTLLLACSNKIQWLLGHRDYIKEPPFLALLVVIAWMAVRERTRPELWVASVAGGLLLGVGIGCRIDVIVFGPFFLFSLLAFVQWSPGRAGWNNRGVAAALFVASFLVPAFPILRTASGGSNLTHTVLLGFMTSFTKSMGLVPPAYDVGDTYADGYAYTLIAAQARVRELDRGPLVFGSREYDRAGARLDWDIVRQFPADTVARCYGAIRQALDYPFSKLAIADSGLLPGFAESPVLSAIAQWRTRGLRWFEGDGVWLTGLAVLIVAAFNLRLAAFCTLAVGYFSAYSMLQYQRRHTFHLDVFSMVAAMFLLQVLVTGARRLLEPGDRKALAMDLRRMFGHVAVFAAVAALAGIGPLAATRWYQQRHVTRLIEATVSETRQRTALSVTAVNAAEVLVSSAGLGERIGPGPVGDVRDVRMDYIAAEFSGAACDGTPFPVRFQYTGVVHTIDKEFERTFQVAPPSGIEPSLVLGPVFYEYGPYWLRFDGLVVPQNQLGCLTALRRAEHPEALPFPFLYATLDPLWSRSALYQRFIWEQP